MSLEHPFEIRDHVEAFLAHYEYECPVYWGFDEKAKQLTRDNAEGRRLVLEIGDDRGAAGQFVAAKQPGRSPARTILVWRFQFELSAWAVDKSDIEDNELQARAAVDVLTMFVRAIAAKYLVQIQWGAPSWLRGEKHAFGRTIRLPFTLDFPIPDFAGVPTTPTPSLTFRAIQPGAEE
jgi:hypothetical protein